jgi:hypothetical protein
VDFLRTGISAIGRLVSLVVLLGAFLAGMTGVVYMSLSGSEIAVPDMVGRDFVEVEKELASLGLKVKRRAERPSEEKINTVLEQLPRAGETVKSGQMILVVVSRAFAPGEEKTKPIIKDTEEDDSKKIEEMITDKPKPRRTPASTNANRAEAPMTRDAILNSTPANSAPASNAGSGRPDDPGRRETSPATTPGESKPPPPPPANRAPAAQPPAGEIRPRTTPRP